MLKRRKDQKLRLRNFDARHGRIGSAAVVKNKKASVRKETVAVSATNPKFVRKNQNTLPPRFPSQPCREVEACRGREESEAKVTMDPCFDNRVDVIKRVLARARLVNMASARVPIL